MDSNIPEIKELLREALRLGADEMFASYQGQSLEEDLQALMSQYEAVIHDRFA